MPTSLARLPSVDLIRGFVAVGRRMSITLAAQDLCLTQSAVSRQIHALEDALGVKLFTRSYRSIAFTARGEHLFRIADNAMQQLQEAVGGLTSSRERMPVTITASIGVAALWLLPRLGRIQRRYPEIDVRIVSDNKLFDLRSGGADLAIRYCTAAAAPPGSVRLFDETLVPVAHASLGIQHLDGAVIAEQVLLEFDDPHRPRLQWADWLASVGLGAHKPKGILRFNQYDQVILATLAGHGIALGRLALVGPMLSDRRLVALSTDADEQPTGYAYWLIQADAAPRTEVRDMIDWIKSEARLTGPLLGADLEFCAVADTTHLNEHTSAARRVPVRRSRR